MHRRSTFIHGADQPFNPEEIQLRKRQLLHPGIKAAREERLTFHFNNLPSDIVENRVSKEIFETEKSTEFPDIIIPRDLTDVFWIKADVHIRWAPETSPGSISPFTSRLPPGLHVSYRPSKYTTTGLLCPMLKKVFSNELKCQDPSISFSQPNNTSDHPGSSRTLQYYSTLPSLNQFVAFIQKSICSQTDRQCYYDAALLNIVDYLDINYDSTAKTLSLSAFWSKAPPAIYDPVGELTTLNQWPLDISSSKDDKVEVGVLSSVPSTDPHEIQLGGFLTVVGEDDKPKPVQFSFPSRHHILSRPEAAKQAYTVSFQEPQGLHPTLEISFASTSSLSPPSNKPEGNVCSLNAYVTLPSSIFADEYAFTAKDPLFEQSHNLRSLRSLSGELDLEAPDYVVDQWGSTMLLELATPDNVSKVPVPDKEWKVTVPLHLRYQPPAEGGFDQIQVPWPVVFWTCSADEDVNLAGNPFDRVHLGYDELFDSSTMFYHLKPEPSTGSGSRPVETIRVPVLDTSKVGGDTIIEQTTLIVILMGFGWVLLKLWPGLTQQLGISKGPITKKDNQKKKQ